MNQNTQSMLLIGAGPMAIEYAKVLKDMDRHFLTVGRSPKTALEFEKIVGTKVFLGGIDKFISENHQIPQVAIVAVSEDQLGIVSRKLIEHNIKSILVEKPGGLDSEDIKKLGEYSKEAKANIYIGYNRRFYCSVKKAQEIIKEDGGVLSIFFDFSEATFKITPLVKAPGVKENWFLQNSTHVIDLVFFLAGTPKKLTAFTNGSLPWHSRGAIFSGAGITERNSLFSYHANWKGPGKWGVELVTANHKLFFRPLEKLQIRDLGSFEIRDLEIDDDLDIKFKPGLFREVQSFLGDKQNLCTISEQVENLKFYQQILEGKL